VDVGTECNRQVIGSFVSLISTYCSHPTVSRGHSKARKSADFINHGCLCLDKAPVFRASIAKMEHLRIETSGARSLNSAR